jgi:hypothetical protein
MGSRNRRIQSDQFFEIPPETLGFGAFQILHNVCYIHLQYPPVGAFLGLMVPQSRSLSDEPRPLSDEPG